MITKINGEAPFQILASSFTISPSENAYTLQVSADGINYSDLFNVAANQTRMITGVAAGSFYRMKGNTSEVSINWRKDCGDDGSANSIKAMQSLPLTADDGTVAATATGVYQFKNGAWKKIEGGGGTGGTEYTAGDNISISPDDVISVTGITSYTGITGEEVIDALGYTPAASFIFNVASPVTPIDADQASTFKVWFEETSGKGSVAFVTSTVNNAIYYAEYVTYNGTNTWTIPVKTGTNNLYQHQLKINNDGTWSNTCDKVTILSDYSGRLTPQTNVNDATKYIVGSVVSHRHRNSTSDPWEYDAFVRTGSTYNTIEDYERLAKASEITGGGLPTYNISTMSQEALLTFWNWAVAEQAAGRNILEESIVVYNLEGRTDIQCVASSAYISPAENRISMWAFYEDGNIQLNILNDNNTIRIEAGYRTTDTGTFYGCANIDLENDHTLGMNWYWFKNSLDGGKSAGASMPVMAHKDGVWYYGIITEVSRQDPNMSLTVEITIDGVPYIGKYSGNVDEGSVVCTSWTENYLHKSVKLTQAEYDALETVDDYTIYIIIG